MAVEKTAPPNLPLSPAAVVGPAFFEQFSNVLRLFFNRLTRSFNGLVEEVAVLSERQEAFVVPISDQTTPLTTGLKMTWRMPYAFTLSEVRASVNTAQASGSILTFDIKESGTSILSTKITIDNTEKTSTTAAAQPVISDAALADDAELTFHIDQIGASGAAGAVLYLIGSQ